MPTRSRPEPKRAPANRARTGRGGTASAERAPSPAPPRRALPEWVWWLGAGVLAFVALLWACRGAMLGSPVVDDYSFLDRLTFQRPLDPFDSMGASYYWRPLSRQLYFSVIQFWLLRAPLAVALLHAGLLALLYLVIYRTARRGFAPPVAAAIAVFPLLADSTRVLLGWPSAAQHLLALLAIAVTLHEALAGRLWTAALAALAGMLSHDSAVFVLPVLPAIAWLTSRRLRDALVWGAAAVGVVAVWGAGYLIARAHGVALPPEAPGGFPFQKIPYVLTQGLVAQLNLEDAPGETRAFFAALYGTLFLVALVILGSRAGRERLRMRLPVVLGGLGFFVVASLPLAVLLPDWNAWRGSVPALGLGLALTALAGLASPWLAGAFVLVRLVTLGFAAPAPTTVSRLAPPTTSHMSFVRLARLQRTVDGARRALAHRFPTLRRGAEVRYWSMPLLCEVGFQGPRAVRVWYGDSTATWNKFGGLDGMARDFDAVVEFESQDPRIAMIVEPGALRLFRRALAAFNAHDYPGADSLFLAADRAQPGNASQFMASVSRNRAAIAYNLGRFAQADSLTEDDFRLAGPTPGHFSMVARLAILRGDRVRAITAIRQCLLLDPNDRDGRSIAAALGMNLQAETGR